MSDTAPATTAARAPASPVRATAWQLLRVAVIAACLGIAYVVATHWDRWVGEAIVQRTDDAYTAADLTPMGARVPGIVQRVAVDDFQRVKAGDLLVQIRQDDYAAQVAAAEAGLETARAQLATLAAQRSQQEANVAAAAKGVAAVEADRFRDSAEARRQQDLLATGIVGTRQRVEQADAANRSSLANFERSQALVRAAVAQLDVIAAQQQQASATIKGKQAELDLARINLGYTHITAPADGEVGLRMVRAGQYVSTGSQVITVVALPHVWVVANYKETQLTKVAVGQRAEIRVDTFPGVVLTGRVNSISPGSGSQFALLPPDNATGNFTKVVQRISVKIELTPDNPLRDRLRPGMSVLAAIDTSSR